MSDTFDFSEYLDQPDGDYKTGIFRKGYTSKGVEIRESYEVILVIKNHQLIGFRMPDGAFAPIPNESSLKYDFTLPPLFAPNIVRYEDTPPFGKNDIVYKIGIDDKGYRWKIIAAIGKPPVFMPLESL